MYSSARATVSRVVGSAKSSGDGHDGRRSSSTWPGLVPHVTCGASVAASMHDLLVPHRAVVGAQRAPVGDRRVPRRRPSARGRGPRRYSNVVSSGAIKPGLGAGLDRHVADRHPAFHRQRPDGRAAVLDDVADAAAGADLADDREDDVLGRDAGGQLAVDRDRHPLRPGLRQRLGGEHVLDLARADAEGERAERAVGGGVAVAAHDGHARAACGPARAR